MPSYLGDYPMAAKDRELKIHRAIYSVLKQEYQNWELIIIADGCKKTVDIINKYKDNRIILISVTKQRIYSDIRNIGIDKATGDYICYLDIDDFLGKEHLTGLNKAIQDNKDWYWFDDYTLKGNNFQRRQCIMVLGKCGTSNVIHKKNIGRWVGSGYAHDWQFIKSLKKASDNFARIQAGEYYVAHIPKLYDV